tara:strand:+ start:376 stop:546 length:171 start_codon:yes stop_codon:yes gene_type:complete
MKDSGWIKIKDFDNSHQELLEDFTDVLNEMGIKVFYEVGSVIVGDAVVYIERKEQE